VSGRRQSSESVTEQFAVSLLREAGARLASALFGCGSLTNVWGMSRVSPISEETNAAGAAAYRSGFYPMQLAVLAVADNFMPIAWWTPISRNPFKFLFAVERKNYSYTLVQHQREAALCCLPWSERKWVAEAGHVSGRTCRKAEALGLPMRRACCLANTWIPKAARAVFEMTLREVLAEEGDHALFVGRVVHGEQRGSRKDAILFLGFDRLASIGISWRMRRGRRGGLSESRG